MAGNGGSRCGGVVVMAESSRLQQPLLVPGVGNQWDNFRSLPPQQNKDEEDQRKTKSFIHKLSSLLILR